MATEVTKTTRKKPVSAKKTATVTPKITNKHLKKIAGLSKLGFLPKFNLDITNKENYPTFNSIKEVGEFLDKHALLYFDINPQDEKSLNSFPETSKDFVNIFFILNTKYRSLIVNQDGVIPENKYRSLGEIYLTFKFYYSKITWKLFLKTFLNSFDEEFITSLATCPGHQSSPGTLSTLICGAINRRVFHIRSISGRMMSSCSCFKDKDEFGFTLKDYYDYVN